MTGVRNSVWNCDTVISGAAVILVYTTNKLQTHYRYLWPIKNAHMLYSKRVTMTLTTPSDVCAYCKGSIESLSNFTAVSFDNVNTLYC